MSDRQGSFDDYSPADDERVEETPDEAAAVADVSGDAGRTDALQALLAPSDERGGDLTCPFCLRSLDDVEKRGEEGSRVAGCPRCDCSIPVDEKWVRDDDYVVI